MNMDWQVRPLSRKSSISGKTFEAGATVICYIFNQGQGGGELIRKDILEEEADSIEISNNLLAKWARKVKNEEPEKQSLGNAEELFLSLYHDFGGEVQESVLKKRDTLKQILGLMLERKRILRRLKTKDKGNIVYLHVATKKEYEVVEMPLDLEEISKIHEQLGLLID